MWKIDWIREDRKGFITTINNSSNHKKLTFDSEYDTIFKDWSINDELNIDTKNYPYEVTNLKDGSIIYTTFYD